MPSIPSFTATRWEGGGWWGRGEERGREGWRGAGVEEEKGSDRAAGGGAEETQGVGGRGVTGY